MNDLSGLCNLPKMSSTFFDMGLMIASLFSVTIISILSPACNLSSSLIFLGIVTCPFDVIVASVTIYSLLIYTSYIS